MGTKARNATKKGLFRIRLDHLLLALSIPSSSCLQTVMEDSLMLDTTTSESPAAMVVDGRQHPSSPSTCSPSQHVPGALISPIPSHVDFSFIPHTKMNPMSLALALSRRRSLACILEDPKSASLPLEKRTKDSLYPPGRLESDDDLSIHISKVQVVEESAQTAAHRLGEVKAQVDELLIAPEAQELRIAWADHARLVDELDTLPRTFDDVVASRIASCLVDDHRIRDAREHAQAEMADATTCSQSISDELSRRREQQQRAILDRVARRLQEDSSVRLTEIHSQLPPLQNRLSQLREGMDASVKTAAEDYFQCEKFIRQRNATGSVNTMQASLDKKFTQFADQCLKEEAAMEANLEHALSKAIASEKGCSDVIDVSQDVIQDKKKRAAQEKDAHAARLADKITRYRETHGRVEVSNEGSFDNVQVHDQVV
ncbi:uncharacterized protein ARMOST_18689 [Armillaria ostoyae]|uniref:Sorting nexin/Vps5-like C-terminal domain-containing protein n=1 Tax=Armillaria ostoyae TaxID=47428 RepID=A0A284S2E7_ARMOS|nr:uncharacterized protein ARMOST_18689 [Armillaria ostoyae]